MKISNALLTIFLVTVLVFVGCDRQDNAGKKKGSQDAVTWREVMEKYQDLEEIRSDVIKLIEEKSQD